jgi:L-aspartate oxidase
LHGANRLASNSLLEGLVYGAHAGRGASAAALLQPNTYEVIPLENKPIVPPSEPLDLADIRNSLKSLMWRSAGVRRAGPQLEEANETIRRWCRYVLPRQFANPAGWELQNMLTVASLMVETALERTESRGVHLRGDYPSVDDEHWRRHLSVVRSG